MNSNDVTGLTRAIGKLEATTEGLARQLAQNHEDMKALIGTQRETLVRHEERLDGFDRDRTRLYTAVGLAAFLISALGIDRFL